MGKTVKLTGIRKLIAQRMSESWNTAPRVVYTLSVDMTKTLALIKKMNEGNEDYAYKLFLKLKDKNYKGGTETIYEYAKEMGVEKIIDWYKK